MFQAEREREREREGGIDLMASNSEVGGSAEYETLMSTSDVELLKRAWRNEKAAPEILQYEGALVERAKEQIELVEGTVDEYVENGIDPLVVSLYQMDLDRTLFLLRSYLRVRLLKIEKFMFHNLKSEEAERRLSEQEKVFATKGESLETVEMERGDLYFIRYKIVKQAIESGQIDLI